MPRLMQPPPVLSPGDNAEGTKTKEGYNMRLIKLNGKGTGLGLLEDNGRITVISYGEAVATIENGELHKVESTRISPTTMKHIKEATNIAPWGERPDVPTLKEWMVKDGYKSSLRVEYLKDFTQLHKFAVQNEAVRITTADTYELFSYGQHVATVTMWGDFMRRWEGYSLTTVKHVNAFRELHNMNKITGDEWSSLPVE